MTAKKFEDLEIRKLSHDLIKELWAIFYNKEFRNRSFQDQIMRAVISISNNISEGYERQSAKELIRYLYIAKWSCWELRNMCYVAGYFCYINGTQVDYFIQKSISLSIKIINLINYLRQKD